MAAKANFYVVLGTDEGRVKEEAAKLYDQLTGGKDDGFTHETLAGHAENAENAFEICKRAAEALATMPFFGGDKVVWLKDADFLADTVTGRAERTLAGVQVLQDALETGLAKGVSFLLSATGIDKRRSFWKFLSKAAKVAIHDKIDTSKSGWEEQVAALVQSRAKASKLEFEPEALEFFVRQAGEATGQIDSELHKLDLYLGEERRLVTLEDVRLMVPMSRAGIVFEIGRALQRGEAGRAIELIDRLLASGEQAVGLMRASIIPTVRNLFLAKVAASLGASGSSYPAYQQSLTRLSPAQQSWLPQTKTGGVNSYPLFLAAGAAARFSEAALRELMASALRADLALVTTGLDARFVLHRFVAEMSAAGS